MNFTEVYQENKKKREIIKHKRKLKKNKMKMENKQKNNNGTNNHNNSDKSEREMLIEEIELEQEKIRECVKKIEEVMHEVNISSEIITSNLRKLKGLHHPIME